jgi:hypothetical protein
VAARALIDRGLADANETPTFPRTNDSYTQSSYNPRLEIDYD